VAHLLSRVALEFKEINFHACLGIDVNPFFTAEMQSVITITLPTLLYLDLK